VRQTHLVQFTVQSEAPRQILTRLIFNVSILWAGHVAPMGEERGVYRVFLGKPEGRNHWGDLSVDGWIILGWISRRWDVGIWTRLG